MVGVVCGEGVSENLSISWLVVFVNSQLDSVVRHVEEKKPGFSEKPGFLRREQVGLVLFKVLGSRDAIQARSASEWVLHHLTHSLALRACIAELNSHSSTKQRLNPHANRIPKMRNTSKCPTERPSRVTGAHHAERDGYNEKTSRWSAKVPQACGV